jgi:hypothetical protein
MLFVALTSFCVNLDGSTIRLGLSNWGTAQKVEVLTVLESSKQVLLPYSERIQQCSIVVESTKAMPSTLYKRTNTDEIQIKISAKDRYWCQYVFQFAHELGHIMCGFKKGDPSNEWFEESICEAASLYVLEKLSTHWSASPPYPTWKSYAPEFVKYRIDRIKGSSCPENFQLPSWWRENRIALSRNAGLRKQNLWIAVKLLSIIEQNPRSAWSACSWLNHSQNGQSKTFEEYLSDWYGACPQTGQKKFVRQVINLFGISTKQDKNK